MPQHSKGTTQKNKITTTTTKATYAKTNNQLKIKNDNKFNSVSSCGRNDFFDTAKSSFQNTCDRIPCLFHITALLTLKSG